MASLKLLPSQKHGIAILIQNRGFNPKEFEWQNSSLNPAMVTPRLLHAPSGFWFRVDIDNNLTFLPTYSPGNELYQAHEYAMNWEEVLYHATKWLGYLKREIETPDLWAVLANEKQLIQNITEESSDNLPFDEAELPQVQNCLEEIKAYVIQLKELTEDQRRIVDARFDHMEKAAARMGRKDWVTMVIGSLMGVTFSLALTGDGTRDLFSFTAFILKRISGTILYLSAPH